MERLDDKDKRRKTKDEIQWDGREFEWGIRKYRRESGHGMSVCGLFGRV
jgi:hypothetical protein